jgi:hypothetical protein
MPAVKLTKDQPYLPFCQKQLPINQQKQMIAGSFNDKS